MLKIQRSANGDVIFTVIGRLAEDNVSELKTLLAAESEDRSIVLDLKDVVLVDRDIVRFLGRCEREGMTLRNCPAYIRAWITQDAGTSSK